MTTIQPKRWAEIRKLADDLIASCSGGAEEADEVDALDVTECRALDTMAFLCNGCDQWYSINERIEDGAKFYCHGCHGYTAEKDG